MHRGHRYAMMRAELARHVAREFEGEAAGPLLAFEPPHGSLPPERIVQAIWHEQLLHAERLRTCSGKLLRVLHVGRWNPERGPDFLDAEIEIDGQGLRGDIEIHVLASDWERHAHGRDFEYNRVVLHAFLRRDDGKVTDTLHHGGTVERAELEPALLADLETLVQSLNAEQLPVPEAEQGGVCEGVFAKLDTAWLRRFFEEAADARMENKIAQVTAQRPRESLDQIFYQMLLTALGHKGSRTLFFVLGKRVPIEELKDFVFDITPLQLGEAIESVLLHVGGLLSLPESATQCDGPTADAETQEYLDTLYQWWSRLGGFYQDRLMEPTRRWYSGVRPPSFPQRRIAGVARVLAEHDFRKGLVASFARHLDPWLKHPPISARDFRQLIAQLAQTFAPVGASYWRWRYSLGGRRMLRAMELIGKEQASSLVFNVLLPIFFCEARERQDVAREELLWRIHDHFPALQENAITRFMRSRLLKTTATGSINFRLEKANQALIYLFHDCCRSNARDCSTCVLRGEQVSDGGNS